MDVYTRDLLVKSRQEDLLREARAAHLVREARLASRAAPRRQLFTHLLELPGRGVSGLLSWRRSQRAAPGSEQHAGRAAAGTGQRPSAAPAR